MSSGCCFSSGRCCDALLPLSVRHPGGGVRLPVAASHGAVVATLLALAHEPRWPYTRCAGAIASRSFNGLYSYFQCPCTSRYFRHVTRTMCMFRCGTILYMYSKQCNYSIRIFNRIKVDTCGIVTNAVQYSAQPMFESVTRLFVS